MLLKKFPDLLMANGGTLSLVMLGPRSVHLGALPVRCGLKDCVN